LGAIIMVAEVMLSWNVIEAAGNKRAAGAFSV
jgi:hypothetical protein